MPLNYIYASMHLRDDFMQRDLQKQFIKEQQYSIPGLLDN